MKGQDRGIRNLLEDYLIQLSKNGYKVKTEKQAWNLVKDYCFVYEIDWDDFYCWLNLSLPQWVKDGIDTANDEFPTVYELLQYLDEQSSEMKEIDRLIAEIG